MENFEPIIVDESINKALITAINKVTRNGFQISKVKDYAYHCKKRNYISQTITRYYLYVLLNEFTEQMYIGISTNIKQRLKRHSKDEVLGPNNEVILNALFLIELEQITKNGRVLSIESQVMKIEHGITKQMRNFGYDARCQINELNEKTENGIIENYLVEKLNEQLIKEKLEEELKIVKSALESFIRISEWGEYECFDFSLGLVDHKCTKEEQLLLQKDAEVCKELLLKNVSQYTQSDWDFIKKCLSHKAIIISLWESGIDNIDIMVVFNRNLHSYHK